MGLLDEIIWQWWRGLRYCQGHARRVILAAVAIGEVWLAGAADQVAQPVADIRRQGLRHFERAIAGTAKHCPNRFHPHRLINRAAHKPANRAR